MSGSSGQYLKQLAANALPSTGGSFTFSGSGGKDVGPFSITITFSNPLLSWTNEGSISTVSIAQGQTYNWNGSNTGGYLYITGASTSASGVKGGFTCLQAIGAQTFTVPSYILDGVPPSKGGTGMQADFFVPFTASGLDSALAGGQVSCSTQVTFQ